MPRGVYVRKPSKARREVLWPTFLAEITKIIAF